MGKKNSFKGKKKLPQELSYLPGINESLGPEAILVQAPVLPFLGPIKSKVFLILKLTTMTSDPALRK